MLAALASLRYSLLICLLLRIVPAACVLVNRTIDDTDGDPSTGFVPSYSPAGAWAYGQQCSSCNVHSGTTPGTIDVTQVHDGTWHDSTYHFGDPDHTVSFSFTGTAVYVFNVIANSLSGTTTFTNLTFWIDNALVGSFTHTPGDTEDFDYNVMVYSNQSLSNQEHFFSMQAGGAKESLILFDYVIYTTEEADTTTTSRSSSPFTASASQVSLPATSSSAASASKSSAPVGAIAGGVVGGVAGIALLGILAFCLVRRRRAASRPPSMAERVDPFIVDQAARHPSRRGPADRRSSRAPILPSLRLGRTRLMSRGTSSAATTTEASSSSSTNPSGDDFQGHRPRLPPMSAAEAHKERERTESAAAAAAANAARSREQAEYASRIQALEAQVRALEMQQQLGVGSDSSGSRTQLSGDSSQRTRGSRGSSPGPRRGNRSGRSGNVNANASTSTANLRSELNSLRNEIAALRGELSQDQLGFVEPAPTYVS